MAIISVEDVTRRHVMGDSVVTALDGVTLSVEAGEFIAVTGRSGSGKTTLLNLLGGLDRPTSGEVIADGVRLSERSDDELAEYRRNRVGFVFQFFNLLGGRTAQQNVEMPLLIAGRPRREREERACALLDQVGLSARRAHRPVELSGGEQQRVAIARALAHDAPLLLADEPTGNLDSKTADEVLDLLAHLSREKGKTVILVTHDAAIAKGRVRRFIEMCDGKVVQDERG